MFAKFRRLFIQNFSRQQHKTLISFATPNFQDSAEKLKKSASEYFQDIHIHAQQDLKTTEFYNQNRTTLDQNRGAGYWLWKPYYILKALLQSNEGDFIVYADAGVEFVANPAPLFNLCIKENGILLFAAAYDDLMSPGPCLNKLWTKRDCFVRMGMDTREAHDGQHVEANFLVLQVNDKSIAFVQEYLKFCEDPLILTDIPSTCPEPELTEFIGHLHDQSVLSILAAKHCIKLHRSPSQWGNHYKPQTLRVVGEYLYSNYKPEAWPDSDYPTILNHHRNKDQSPRIRTYDDLYEIIFSNRESLLEIPSWIDSQTYSKSINFYGLPPEKQQLINAQKRPDPSYTDIICELTNQFTTPIRYLELGASFGKNFFQIMRHVYNANLTGVDYEDINPILEAQLSASQLLSKWPSPEHSIRNADSSATTFSDHTNANSIVYICGDLRDEKTWKAIAQKKYNFIFSDAFETEEDIENEWAMIGKYNLLSPDEFVFICDDLHPKKKTVFLKIWRSLKDKYALSDKSLITGQVRGWLSENEPLREIGIITNLNTTFRDSS